MPYLNVTVVAAVNGSGDKVDLDRVVTRVHDLINMSNVAVVCTTDDPADTLDHHKAIAANPGKLKARVYPAFRPDKALAVAILHNRMCQPPATSQDPIRAAVTAAFGPD